MSTATHIAEEARRIATLPYAREVIPNADGTWFAKVTEFTGCMTEGDTQGEALANLEDAMIGWLEAKLEDGDPIPAPSTVEDYSGKFLVRVPKSLHRDLARRADHEGVSLNQYVATALARAVSSPDKANDVTVNGASFSVVVGNATLDHASCAAQLFDGYLAEVRVLGSPEASAFGPTSGPFLLTHFGPKRERT